VRKYNKHKAKLLKEKVGQRKKERKTQGHVKRELMGEKGGVNEEEIKNVFV